MYRAQAGISQNIYMSVDSFVDALSSIDKEQLVWTVKTSSQAIDFMDLTIEKEAGFEGHGRISTRTYQKPGFAPQYLAFLSQHNLACKRGIFRGEAHRHMLNCSQETQYDKFVTNLRSSMLRRGVPNVIAPRSSLR